MQHNTHSVSRRRPQGIGWLRVLQLKSSSRSCQTGLIYLAFSTCLTDFEFPFVRCSFVPRGGRAVKNFWRSWARSPLSFWRGRGWGPFENIENSPPSRTEREPTAFERNRAGAHRIRKKQSASRTGRCQNFLFWDPSASAMAEACSF